MAHTKLRVLSHTHDTAKSDGAELQQQHTFYKQQLIEKMQQLSQVQRSLSKIEHEISRIEQTLANITTVAERNSIQLQKDLTN